MKNYFLLILWLLFPVMGNALYAADMTATLKDNTANSGFSVVNASGTTTVRFRGDGNVGVGTTTPSARFMIVGSSTSSGDASLIIRTGSSNDVVYARNDGKVGIGTSTPSTTLHVVGTVTATGGFSGNGSGLTNISATTVSGDSVSSASIVDGSVSGGDLASTLSMSTKSLDIGSITVNAGNFRVDSTGSMTASTITSTGSVTASTITTTGTLTASGNLNIGSGTLFVDSVNNRVGIGTATPSTALHVVGTLTVSGKDVITDTQTSNTIIGFGAGSSIATTGIRNSAFGYQALYTNGTGTDNTAVGYRALYSNTRGYYNTANGMYALYSNTTGNYNTANGCQALYSNTTGNLNTVNGLNALYFNTDGNNNTALGYGAGLNTTGSGSVFLGYQAGYNETGSNKLYIANGSSTTLIYGDFSTSKVGIGTTTPSTTLHVIGTVTATAYAGGGGYTHYVGELYGGGVVFYVYKTAGVEHGLICSTADLSTSQAWSDVTGTLIGATAQSAWDGLSNSNAIVAQSGHTSSAAKLCLDYTNTETGTGVYSDWYLPSRYELDLMHSQRFIICKTLNSDFASNGYWCSTESSSLTAWTQNLVAGTQFNYSKANAYYVRAVRAF